MGKKGGSSTTVQSYKPTEQEIRLQKAAADYSEAIAPNALWLNGVARGLLQDSLGTIQVDYNQLLNNANQQTSAAQQGVANLTQGILPSAYQQNMENAIRSGVNNTMGSTLNNLGARGILNSSVTNTAMNDISKNAADTMARLVRSAGFFSQSEHCYFCCGSTGGSAASSESVERISGLEQRRHIRCIKCNERHRHHNQHKHPKRRWRCAWKFI